MARHRKIDMRMHGDAKYRRLTPPCPCGQALWWYLLAGPQTDIIPGLSAIGEAAFAELLRWPLEGFRKAFAEVFREGLAKADWDARLVFVPNALKYNHPASPNVVLSWRPAWDELPECDLKNEAFSIILSYLKGLGKGFGEAFGKVSGKGFGESGTGTGTGTGERRQPPLTDEIKRHEQAYQRLPEGFAEFFAGHPNKTKKQRAVEAWKALSPDSEMLARIMEGQKRWLNSKQWADGKVELASTWLTELLFEEVPDSVVSAGKPKTQADIDAFARKCREETDRLYGDEN